MFFFNPHLCLVNKRHKIFVVFRNFKMKMNVGLENWNTDTFSCKWHVSIFVPLSRWRPPDLYGQPSLAGVLSAALCPSGPPGPWSSHHTECWLDQQSSISDYKQIRRRCRKISQGAVWPLQLDLVVTSGCFLLVCLFFNEMNLTFKKNIFFFPQQKTQTELDDVFDNFAVLMRQMSSQCKVS